MPDAELDSASAPSMEPYQAPASSVPDTKPNAVSVPTTEGTQAASTSTPTFYQWRRIRRTWSRPSQAPASSVPDTEPNTVSVPTTEETQAASTSTPTFHQWRWRIRPTLSRPVYEVPEFSTLEEEVRRAMRTVPHALAVITSKTPLGVTKGLVVSSFNTVTMHPKPYVTFNIKLPSSTYDAIARSRRFTITSIWSAATAKAFANPKFSAENPLPLEDSDPRSLHSGGLFSLDCKWIRVRSVKISDHVIMLGRVDEYHPGRPQNIAKPPLVYVKGDYQVGPRSNP